MTICIQDSATEASNGYYSHTGTCVITRVNSGYYSSTGTCVITIVSIGYYSSTGACVVTTVSIIVSRMCGYYCNQRVLL